MKRIKIVALILLCTCAVLFTSCGNSKGTTADSGSKAVQNVAESESQPEEKQPYEILREKQDETKQIAADEEQQEQELSKALSKLTFQYGQDESLGDYLAGLSQNCIDNESQGKSCIVPMVYILGPSTDPIMFNAFNYIGDQYLDFDTVEIDTAGHRYTYGSSTFITDVQKDTVTITSNNVEKTEEVALRLVMEDDLDVLVDIVESDEVGLTFAKYNTAKPELVECEMPNEDRQAITDALNAYYLYLNASEKVRAKALADLETIELE